MSISPADIDTISKAASTNFKQKLISGTGRITYSLIYNSLSYLERPLSVILETHRQNSYIPGMKKILFLALVFSLVPHAAKTVEAQLAEPRSMQLIVNLDREISGLLDAYLEAVPECPVHPDTPVRLWVLDLAWLRADAAIDEAETLLYGSLPSDSAAEAWTSYLASSIEYLNVFSEIQRTYHQTAVPESTICIELENSILYTDSVWRTDEIKLFELFAKEEMQ